MPNPQIEKHSWCLNQHPSGGFVAPPSAGNRNDQRFNNPVSKIPATDSPSFLTCARLAIGSITPRAVYEMRIRDIGLGRPDNVDPEEIHALAANQQLIVFPQGRHYLMLDHADELAEAIVHWHAGLP